ncbi:Kelch motif family protein [Tritrichomonas foetus]|uniref:Kelch motif family protein n=1 Tax=Tritrichomonas foetus TaxID=1144522 RepID=A0A1J4KJS6_9EUKA|nr:Kelch motif family protein [Tritrichomonas foetus]|eukprot:OHT11545.1 Kelch motif family protein [Tritrichomonas foetus]
MPFHKLFKNDYLRSSIKKGFQRQMLYKLNSKYLNSICLLKLLLTNFISKMSYCPSFSPLRQDFLPGVSSIPDGRRINCARSITPNSMAPDFLDSSSSTLPFSSLWSVVPVTGDSPVPKSGQTVVFWADDHSILTCYGRSKEDTFSDEFWKFSLTDQKWEKLPVKDVTPRAACGSALVDSKLWFYGGITSFSFVRDLHYVDLETFEVVYPVTTGDLPPPCALPLVAYYYPYLIVWAGTSGSNLSSFHVLNTEELHWRKVETDFVGRQGACGAIINSTFYIFGASSPMSILTIDMETFEFKVYPTTGNEPPNCLDCLTTYAVGSTFMAFETIGVSSKTRLFVFDTDRFNWMSYSVPLSDLSEEEACTPKIVFYLPDERKLVALCEKAGKEAKKDGCEETEAVGPSQPLTELNIGRSIATLNQRLDFLSMLKSNNNTNSS